MHPKVSRLEAEHSGPAMLTSTAEAAARPTAPADHCGG